LAVVFDNASSSTTNGANTTLTFSHTTSGSDRALGVGVSINIPDNPDSVTYNGVSMTMETSIELDDGDNSSLWKLENPASGAHDVVVTVPSACGIVAGAVSVTGADQVDCISNSNQAKGTSTSPSVTVTSATGELVMANIMSFNNVTWTPEGTEDERWDLDEAGGVNCNGWGATDDGASSVTINPTQSSSVEWGICAMSFRAVSGALGGGYWQLEENTDRWLLEDGSGLWTLEETAGDPFPAGYFVRPFQNTLIRM
jgi:hypothetical protein